MKVTLTDAEGERLMNGDVDDKDWVRASIDMAWAYLNHTGADSITVRSNEPPATTSGSYVRICTVALTLHDED